jgi:UDP-N-acetylmuramyl pentapeptide phosphotransferase/UDP-N-acetylglucosamine-1-phosphate transferase
MRRSNVSRKCTKTSDPFLPRCRALDYFYLQRRIAQQRRRLEIAPFAHCVNASGIAIPDLFGMHDSHTAFAAMATLLAAAVLSTLLIIALGPWLARYAMAEPNARSSHKLPTPQGGGIAVIGAAIVVSGGVLFFSRPSVNLSSLVVISAAVLLIAAIGALADKRPIAAAPRLLLQSCAVAALLATLPSELRLLPVLPWWSERILLFIGTLWFVNLVNFMDGLDWMTVAEAVPITLALGVIGLLGYLPWQDTVISLALCGATIGFAFFNRPVAKLFLGDVGSLPIGLLLGWLLLVLAGNGGRTAAALLPLYYKHEPVWLAHRSHFYQRATDRGFRVIEVVTRVFVVNILLAALAFVTILLPSPVTDIAAVSVGMALVAWLLVAFARGPARHPPHSS